MGVELGPADVAFRLNLVTLMVHGGDLYMEDFSAGHITTDEARELIASCRMNSATKRSSSIRAFPTGTSWSGAAAARISPLPRRMI